MLTKVRFDDLCVNKVSVKFHNNWTLKTKTKTQGTIIPTHRYPHRDAALMG